MKRCRHYFFICLIGVLLFGLLSASVEDEKLVLKVSDMIRCCTLGCSGSRKRKIDKILI